MGTWGLDDMACVSAYVRLSLRIQLVILSIDMTVGATICAIHRVHTR